MLCARLVFCAQFWLNNPEKVGELKKYKNSLTAIDDRSIISERSEKSGDYENEYQTKDT